MAYIICEPCIGTKDTACVDVCPVDCIHPRPNEPEFSGVLQLYIDAQNCICCAACVPVCPVQAIFPEAQVLQETAATHREFFDPKNAPSLRPYFPFSGFGGEVAAAGSYCHAAPIAPSLPE